MGKFSQAGRTGGGSSALERLASQAQPELPATSQEEVAVTTAPNPAAFQQAAQDTSINLARAEELPSPFQQQQDPQAQLEADLAEQQRQSVPNLRERWAQVPTPAPIEKATASQAPDGGIINRANKMAEAVQTGGLLPPVSVSGTAGWDAAAAGRSGPEIAAALEPVESESTGKIQAAINRVGAVDYSVPQRPVVDPDFVKAGSLVTENMIMQLAGGAQAEAETFVDPILEAQGEVPETGFEGKKAVKQIAKQQGNAAVGQQIAQEYQRLKGVEVPTKIPTKEAETLGDAFKMMWVAQNNTLATVTLDPETQQRYIELTPEGEDVLAKGEVDRRRLFPTQKVRPAKQPLRTGKLPGDVGQNVVKNVQGQVGKQKFGKVLEESMKNLAQVPNVVDQQRMRILYATALPVLRDSNFDSPFAKINNIGADKRAKYIAANKGDVAAADAEMQKAAFKLAQEVQSIAQERNGANYLSYAIQGFQGRVSPQQSKFNPTTSKAVRFVTRNAVPAPAKPGSRVDYNLRQMYAMMLVPDADEVLPHIREQKFEAFAPQLEAWGDRLEQALQMTNEEAEAISQAIEQGLPLSDPNFPEVKPLALDPEADAELINKIASKGEDGPHFIDGLIDAAKYIKARKAGRTHHSYFNAYIDGKTNGIASNGIQMGNSKTAQQTGVLRASETDYLDEPGDVRAVLRDTLMEQLDRNGFDGNVSDYSSELNAVARAVFNHRDLNKKTTMTFGYGKEVDTFGQDMADTMQLLKADPNLIKDPAMREAFLAALPEVEARFPTDKEFGDTLMTVYAPALESVMSPEALLSRDIMRGAAMLHAATNQLMAIEGPTGMDLHFGRDVNVAEEITESRYTLKGSAFKGGKTTPTAIHQTKAPTSAAARTYTQEDEAGNVTTSEQVGDYAYGGSVVGPVQALDAATVGLTTSGKSWNRLKQASGNNPYIHTIYDAFKADAMGFDVVLEEVNQNWLDASMNWSYLEETQKATREKMTNWRGQMKQRLAQDPNAPITESEAAYMNFILKAEENAKGEPSMKNFYKKVGTAGSFHKRKLKPFEQMKNMADAMKNAGYNWLNPPAQPTVKQLWTFVNTLENILDTDSRLSNAIRHTNSRKKELRKEIMEKGYKTKSGRTIPLQYYAH